DFAEALLYRVQLRLDEYYALLPPVYLDELLIETDGCGYQYPADDHYNHGLKQCESFFSTQTHKHSPSIIRYRQTVGLDCFGYAQDGETIADLLSYRNKDGDFSFSRQIFADDPLPLELHRSFSLNRRCPSRFVKLIKETFHRLARCN